MISHWTGLIGIGNSAGTTGQDVALASAYGVIVAWPFKWNVWHWH